MDEQVSWDVGLVAKIRGMRFAFTANGVMPGRLTQTCLQLRRKLFEAARVYGGPPYDIAYERRLHDRIGLFIAFDPFAPAEEPVTQTHPCA